jgi:pectinesterase
VTIGGALTGTSEAVTNLTVYGYSGQTGPLGVATQLLTITGGSWTGESSYNSGRYFEFTTTPAVNNNFIVDTISMTLGGKGGGNMKAEIFYSTDGFATSNKLNATTIALGNGTNTTLSYGGLGLAVPQGKTISLRIFPFYTSTSSGKYIAAQSVVIKGRTTAIPVVASSLWSLLANGSANVSGLVSANDISFDGANLYHYGYNANGDQWTNHLPSDGAWPAETSPNFSRYAQFAVAPQTGVTMYVDSIKFNQVVESTATLRMALYYSKDQTFTSKTFIADTTVAAGSTTYQFAIAEDTIQTGEKFYLRFYPYNTNADPSTKLIDVDSVAIIAKTTGSLVITPIVATTSASYISTTFLTTGGNVTADGGGTISAKGVCWNTTGSPTITDSYLVSGTGVGPFSSFVTGLIGGTTYHLRAYATNIAGSAYGNEITFTTLSAVVVPTITTTALSNIMAVTATSGGNVTAWGGAAVTGKGICWNTIGSAGGTAPTIADAKTIDGSDIGSFSSALSNLSGGTKYYVRAYATNSAGTGYGSELSFTTQTIASDTMVVVAKDGSGNYTTVGAAFTAVPTNYTGKWTIFVKKGNYHEKDTLAAGKVNVILIGEDKDSTIIWNDDFSDKYGTGNPGTSGTFTVAIDASDFIAKNITIANTYWPSRYGTVTGTQGVALRTQGDRHQYINCRLLGYQDTYYTYGGTGAGRMYHKNCYIAGTVDYIFGRNLCVFDSCTLATVRIGGTVTAGGTDPASLYGYVFRNCTLFADTVAYTDTAGFAHTAITSASPFYLGRPWQSNPRTVFINCYEPASLAAAGWTSMQVNPTLYAEYHCYGPGAVTSRGTVSAWPTANQARQLTNTEAATYSLTNVFARSSASSSLILYDWYPNLATPAEDMNFTVTAVEKTTANLIPHRLTLGNYPNPFNPETNIQFTVAASGRVVIKIYNILGQEVARVFDGQALVGQEYKATFGGSRFASGVYFCSIESNGQRMVTRMLLLK